MSVGHRPGLRRRRLLAWGCGALAGCGGGGGGGSGSGVAAAGSFDGHSITSQATGTTYPLSIRQPPASAGPRSGLTTLYLLDGESWFDTAASVVQAANLPVIVVGIGTAGQRNRDFVPGNGCTTSGGGNDAYLDFLRRELAPAIEADLGGDPARRALFGHSHGGSLVLYALFSEAATRHTFRSYLSCDASIGCLSATADFWERSYAAAYGELPVRLHLSYATQGNFAANEAYAYTLGQRGYAGLEFVNKSFAGTHGGIVPAVLAEAVAFAAAP